MTQPTAETFIGLAQGEQLETVLTGEYFEAMDYEELEMSLYAHEYAKTHRP